MRTAAYVITVLTLAMFTVSCAGKKLHPSIGKHLDGPGKSKGKGKGKKMGHKKW